MRELFMPHKLTMRRMQKNCFYVRSFSVFIYVRNQYFTKLSFISGAFGLKESKNPMTNIKYIVNLVILTRQFEGATFFKTINGICKVKPCPVTANKVKMD